MNAAEWKLPLACWVLACVACAGTVDDTPIEDDPTSDKEFVAKAVMDGKADFGQDPCEREGWYEDETCDWFCPRRDPVCSPEPIFTPRGAETNYPIILAHGFMAGPELIPFYQVADVLRDDGHVVYEGRTFPFDSIENRGLLLARQIDDVLAETGAERVNLIAHSMGGLDSRFVISSLGYGDRVASLTTISTPHRGSFAADKMLDVVTPESEKLLNDFAKMIARPAAELAEGPDLRAGIRDLTEERAPTFNTRHPNDERVYYQSWAGVSNYFGIPNDEDFEACDDLWHGDGTRDVLSPLFVTTAAETAHGLEALPNDGMVTVESAKWGRFRGCVPADHADEVGQINDDEPNSFTGFDHRRFFRTIAFELATRGY